MTPEEKVFNPEQESRDLGFGSVLSRQRQFRLLNRDGSFNIEKEKQGLLRSLRSYHVLLSMPWWQFFAVVMAGYLALNVLFAAAYALCGSGALQGAIGTPGWLRPFFFSVHTFSTIGYGSIVPVGVAANTLVAIESLAALLGFALATGLVFARFSRPTAEIMYSRYAVIAPYRGITAFQFRIINGRDNQLIELQAGLVLSRFESVDGVRQRKFYPLALERSKVSFFPLNWTIVHPIDSTSPLFGWTQRMTYDAEVEFFILLTGIDETFSQTVHSRSSYTAEELVWGARFVPLVTGIEGGRVRVDMQRFDQVEAATLPLEALLPTGSEGSQMAAAERH